uniref:Uncharacterized protein n=1 Tax=Hyaloperonospora arabidopsidis (strain Emoy2) TaxID=559515 RepID=M4BDY1_HYAAE
MCCLLLFQLPFYLGLLVVSLLMPNARYHRRLEFLRDYILDNMDKADRDEDTREALLGTGTGSPQGSSMTTTMW